MATATRERARPLLGTIVRIRVTGPHARLDPAIDAAFIEVAAVHEAMSAQSPVSDVARINGATATQCIKVDFRTLDCLAAAADWSRRSNGVFDAVAAAGRGGSWHDIELDEAVVRLRRPVALDLSGIAKGYAVDRACTVLRAHGVAEGMVEAGGDLRVFGDREEPVALRPGHAAQPAVVTIADGALAASDVAVGRAEAGRPSHFDGRSGERAEDAFVAVAAPTCVDADALTKIVLVLGDAAGPLLDATGAIAYRHDGREWSTIGKPH